MHPLGDWLLTGTPHGAIQRRTPTDLAAFMEFQGDREDVRTTLLPQAHRVLVSQLLIRRDGVTFSASHDADDTHNDLARWDATGRPVFRGRGRRQAYTALKLSADGRWLLGVRGDIVLRLPADDASDW
jgi:hypothetical protein